MTHKYLRSDYRLSPPRWSVILALTLCLVLMEVDEGSAGTTTATAGPFCDSSILRDYERPLRALPPGNPLPKQLSFGPPSLEALALKNDKPRLLFRGAEPGFFLRNADAGTQIELNWVVKIRVSRPGLDGSASELVSEAVKELGIISPGGYASVFGERFPTTGPFRLDIAFFDQDGELLGSYFEYLQVVPYIRRVRLGLSRHQIAPGGVLKVRLENWGTQVMAYGNGYVLERHAEGQWTKVLRWGRPFVPPRSLGAGYAGICQDVKIPNAAEPGLYRVRKNFGFLRARGSASKTFRVNSNR